MAGLREIQGRIRSIEDTRKITGAMYMISSTKKGSGKDGTIFLYAAVYH